MKIWATAALALTALARNKLRSSLTALGVIIGVSAVVTMQSMGEGATAYVGEAISGLGSNMLIAVPGAARGMSSEVLGAELFTEGDIAAISREARDIAHVAPINGRSVRVIGGGNNRTVSSAGVTASYFAIRGWGVSRGRLITEDDQRHARQVCLIGETVQSALFGTNDALGRELRVRNVMCTVVGVLEAKGAAVFGIDQDDVLYMPLSTFSRRVIGLDRIGQIMVSAVSDDALDSAKSELTSILHRRRHIREGEDDDFAVRDPREMQALFQNVTGILTTLLAAIAAISLLVGGIGIMNIMLVSVTERTREIGVRLAVGARASDILAQFLVEAVFLSTLGGAIGVAVGLGAAYGIAAVIHVPFVVPLSLPIAFGVAVLVGIVFGVVPARKASRMSPLAALRFE